MLNRWIGIAFATLMASANGALFLKDIMPGLAEAPPSSQLFRVGPGQKMSRQMGLYGRENRRFGYSWTSAHNTGAILSVRNWTIIRPFELPQGSRTPPIRIDTELSYREDTLDTLDIKVYGLEIEVEIRGELVPPNDFPISWRVGEARGKMLLSAEDTRALGDVIRPFTDLQDLFVGRTWRFQLVNPLARLLPGWSGTVAEDAEIARVTSLDRIRHAGEEVSAHRVEARSVIAWVGPDGRVLRQEVELPIFGRLIVLEEPFDERLWQRIIRRSEAWR